MPFKLGRRSLGRLRGVHPDLVRIVQLAITKTDVDFTVGEGLRSKARQRHLLATGKSKTMHSRHLTGHAVDLWALHPDTGKVTWKWKYYYPLAKAMKAAAYELKLPLEWGGDWRTFRDGPHNQLPWGKYK